MQHLFCKKATKKGCNFAIVSLVVATIFARPFAVVRADMESAPTKQLLNHLAISMQIYAKMATKKGCNFAIVSLVVATIFVMPLAIFSKKWQQKKGCKIASLFAKRLLFDYVVNYASTGVSTGASVGCAPA